MTDEKNPFTPVERSTSGHATRGNPVRRMNDRYDSAPVTHPGIGQNTLACRDCGSLVFDREAHDKFHDRIDALESHNNNAPMESDKITEPLKSPTPRAKKVTE